jgi:hypothetical protein
MAILAISLCAVAFTATQQTVAADPCVATLNYPTIPTVYGNSNVPIVVPMSATCTNYYGSQLYATGNAYDATSNVALGSVSTTLTSVDGGTTFTGQLGFELPPTTQGHTVQISASIYNSQYGNMITATSETLQVGAETQQYVTTTVTQTPYSYPYQTPYQSSYPISSTYPSQTSPQSQHHVAASQYHYESRYSNNDSLLAYAAIFTILATVIIATGALLVYARRQPIYAQMPPPTR